jgi:hypothetical protein
MASLKKFKEGDAGSFKFSDTVDTLIVICFLIGMIEFVLQ